MWGIKNEKCEMRTKTSKMRIEMCEIRNKMWEMTNEMCEMKIRYAKWDVQIKK